MRLHQLLLTSALALSIGIVSAQTPSTVTLLTHDSFALSEDVLAEFEAETGYKLEILRAGDTGTMLNQAILTKNSPLADVMFGVDNTFLSRALEQDIFVPYASPELAQVAEAFRLDAENRVTPIDYGDVCLNYDIAYFEAQDLAVPQSLADLTLAEYRGLLVAMNPATSSPGLAFLLASIGAFGEADEYDYLDFWADLIANEALIVEDWETAYFGYFTGGNPEGEYPLVVSYASSPPFTVDETSGEATTASIIAPATCFRQIEFAGILRNSDNQAGAEALIDFLLSERFQSDLPMQMYVFPVREGIELPEAFAQFAAVPEEPAEVAYADIEAKREEWISGWLEVVTR